MRIVPSFLISAALVLCATQSYAHAVKVATVNMQKAIQTVNEGKNARSSLEKAFNVRKAELQKEEAEIKRMAEELKKQSLVMNEKTRMKKQGELQERIMKLQEKTARSQMEFQQREQKLTAPILNTVKELVNAIAKEKEYTLVLETSQQNVLYSLDKDDITEEVIARYNKKKK